MVVAFKVRIFQKSQISIQVKSFCQVIFFVIMSVTLVVHISDSQHLTVESDQCVFYVVVSCQLVVCARKKPSVDNVQESGVSPSLVNCRREPCVVLLGLHLYRSCNINPLFSALFKHPVVHSVSFQKSSMCGGWVVVVCVVGRFGGENPFYWKQQGFVVEQTQKSVLLFKKEIVI